MLFVYSAGMKLGQVDLKAVGANWTSCFRRCWWLWLPRKMIPSCFLTRWIVAKCCAKFFVSLSFVMQSTQSRVMQILGRSFWTMMVGESNFQLTIMSSIIFPCGVRTQGYGCKIRCCCLVLVLTILQRSNHMLWYDHIFNCVLNLNISIK